MAAKRSPASRRASSQEHTQEWLSRRQVSWDNHEAGLLHAHSKRQQIADQVTQARQQAWDDYWANEAQRTAQRDTAAQEAHRQQLIDELSHPPRLQQVRDSQRPQD